MSLRLDVGCGENKKSGMLGIDFIKKSKIVDIVADAKYLPIKENSLDYIYSCHVIEYLSHCDTEATLKEWLRVLKIGGTLECPDLRICCLPFAIRPTSERVIGMFVPKQMKGNFINQVFLVKCSKKFSGIWRSKHEKNMDEQVNGKK